MHKEQLSYQMLLEKSKEMGLTFSNLLGGAVLEEVVRRFSTSDHKENLWLRNAGILGKEQYEKNLVLSLEYDYVIQKLKKEEEEKSDTELLLELFDKCKETVLEGNTDYGMTCSVTGKPLKRYLQIQINAQIEEMQIPISVKIYLLRDDKLIPKKDTFSSMIFPKNEITYYSYPTESFLAEKYMEVITKLELIQNLGAYYDIYHMLEQSVDGRKVKEYIEEECEKAQISKDKSRLDMISGYRDYTYMKKKWKVFLRSVNSKEPSWEQVVERFMKFFEPIWQAVMDDFIFFGDWMPELNRFL